MSVKILVVDDEVDMQELFRWWFRRSIKNKEYEFVFATSAGEALKLLGMLNTHTPYPIPRLPFFSCPLAGPTP